MTIEPKFNDLPMRMRHLPIDMRGYPVPKFVEWIDGKPDFRVMSGDHYTACIKQKLCWVCGDHMGVFKAFVVGPMCAVNRISAEPPSHVECANWSATHCPFLTDPDKERRERLLPQKFEIVPGMLKHNPGVTLVWVTKSYTVIPAGKSVLVEMGDPVHVQWYRCGRPATRAEVMGAVETGLPFLRDMARKDGPNGIAELDRYYRRFEKTVDLPLV